MSLEIRGIPYIIGGKVGLFKRPEAQALGRIFAWFSDRGFWTEDAYSKGSRIEGEIFYLLVLNIGTQHITMVTQIA